jgi:hypothetical protein
MTAARLTAQVWGEPWSVEQPINIVGHREPERDPDTVKENRPSQQ